MTGFQKTKRKLISDMHECDYPRINFLTNFNI